MDKPNFYAIIPASVRYDTNLSSSEKLFYAEVTALSQKEGFCWASNTYFAKLFNVSPSTVSAWANNLKLKGHIIIEYEKEGKNIKKRIIYPIQKIDYPYTKNLKGVVEKSEGGYSENLKENNTSINNTSIKTYIGAPLPKDVEEEYQNYKEYMAKEKHRIVGIFQEEQEREFLKQQPDPVGVIKQTIRNGWMKLLPKQEIKQHKKRRAAKYGTDPF